MDDANDSSSEPRFDEMLSNALRILAWAKGAVKPNDPISIRHPVTSQSLKNAIKKRETFEFPDDVLHDSHLLIEAYLQQTSASGFVRDHDLSAFPAARKILEKPTEELVRVFRTLLVRLVLIVEELSPWGFQYSFIGGGIGKDWFTTTFALRALLARLFRRRLPLTGADWLDFLSFADLAAQQGDRTFLASGPFLNALKKHIEEDALPLEFQDRLREFLRFAKSRDRSSSEIKMWEKIERMLGKDEPVTTIEPGEAWADNALQDLQSMTVDERAAWARILGHAWSGNGSKPSQKWLKEAERLVGQCGKQTFTDRLGKWLPLMSQPRTQPKEREAWERDPTWMFSNNNAQILRGLIWMCATMDDPNVCRMLGDTAEICFKKIRDVGPRCPKVGNACLYVLSVLPGPEAVAQLSRIKTKVKHASSRRMTEKALGTVADRSGLSNAELEEMSVPTFCLDPSGRSRRKLGSYTGQISVSGSSDVDLVWFQENGKKQKSIPAEVRQESASELKELQRTVKELRGMLPVQRNRIERLLMSERQWEMPAWRERYLNHPLVGILARRMIWHFRLGDQSSLGAWLDGRLVDADDRPLEWLTDATQVRLWHPIGSSVKTVQSWRQWLDRHQVTQPFKQAHREVYILTDAEMNTATYSNRFAAHIIRQHQFSALCRERGWKYHLQGNWDSANTPNVYLPEWGIHAEFWADQPDPGLNENLSSPSGVSLYLSTDQVRFYREGVQLPLTEVPVLAFSEVMRDVDLFVGVASVGNDPTWHDRGEAGGYAGYWRQFAFGELSESAKTRHEVLSHLLPRLKIAERCSLEDKFLKVRGQLRTYKIHLGSSNILMEPNDQYLCIVPGRGLTGPGPFGKLFLPFEGDQTLSVILSKAFLLAEDNKIKDPSITNQIRRK
jgi:hypothetical protein